MDTSKTFTPPTRHYTPPILPSTPNLQRSPAGYFSHTNIPKPVNVFKMNDGTYTEDQIGVDFWSNVAFVYFGGHTPYTVSAAEAAALTAAGYGANIVQEAVIAVFTPPTRGHYTPSVNDATPEWQLSPARFFIQTNIPRPVNVFKLNDGTYTETQSGVDFWSQVAVAYYGGHTFTVSTAEAAALTSAGYGANIT